MTGQNAQPNIVRAMDKVAPEIRDALRGCAMGEKPWPLLLTGNVGAGKTCAALALLDFVTGVTFYYTVADLCAYCVEIQQGRVRDDRWRGDEKMTGTIFWVRWTGAELCVLDELGQRQQVSDFNFDTTKKAIDLREGKPLVIVSNLDGEEIASVYDERIASRCVSGTVVSVTGRDRRLAGVAK
jgi:DNA replication protein DnaC